MTGQLIRHTLRGRRRAVVWFSVGMSLYALMIMGLWPSYREIDLASLYESLPEPLVKALAGDTFGPDAAGSNALAQYLGSQFATWLPLVLAYFGMWVGSGVVVRAYDRHRMDVLLAQPLPRWRFLVARYVAVAVGALPIVGFSALALIVGAAVWAPDGLLSSGGIVLMHVQLWLFTLAVAGVGLLLGVLLLEPARTYGAGAAIVVVMYVLRLVGDIAPGAEPVGYVSLFRYWRPMDQLMRGTFPWQDATVLAGVALATATAAVLVFRRRDMAS